MRLHLPIKEDIVAAHYDEAKEIQVYKVPLCEISTAPSFKKTREAF